MRGVDCLPVTDGDAVETDQVCAVVGLQLLQVQDERVQVLNRHLVVLDHHVRAVVDRHLVHMAPVPLLLLLPLLILYSPPQRQTTQKLNLIIVTNLHLLQLIINLLQILVLYLCGSFEQLIQKCQVLFFLALLVGNHRVEGLLLVVGGGLGFY